MSFVSEKNDTVVLTYPYNNEVAHSWSQSLVKLINYDAKHKRRLERGGWISSYADSGAISRARNALVQQFLENTDGDWLFWIDTDMGFDQDALEMLIEYADPVERPIMSGLCFGQKTISVSDDSSQARQSFPTILSLQRDFDGWTLRPMSIYTPNELIKCDATGAAFMIVHRSVYEKLEDNPYDGLILGENKGPFSEDISFCVRALQAGFPTYVHTGIRTTHFKERWLSEVDHWRSIVPPYNQKKISILVPNTNMQNSYYINNFLESVQATTSLATVYWVEDPLMKSSSELAANSFDRVPFKLLESVATHVPDQVNQNFWRTEHDWVLVIDASSKLMPGWLDHAMGMADTTQRKVIGLNDGSKLAVNQEYSPAVLINKSFLKEHNLIEKVFNPDYKFFWLDELIQIAKNNNEWVVALGSIMRNDAIPSQKKIEDVEKDKALFLSRNNL